MTDTVPSPSLPDIGTESGIPESDIAAAYSFCHRISAGWGRLTACLDVGWYPAKLERYLKDKAFLELVEMSEQLLNEEFESVLYAKARGGNQRALEMVLYNRMPGKWRDRTSKNEPLVKVDVSVITGAKEGILALIREQGAAALQPPAAIEATARDAEPS